MRRSHTLRTGLAVVAFAGSALAPTTAFAAASHGARAASPATPSADQCTVVKKGNVGAGLGIRMTMSPQGPSVDFIDVDGSRIAKLGTLDRSRPALPQDAGIDEEILNPYGSTPQLLTKTDGGNDGLYGLVDFPRLPKGCSVDKATVIKQCTVVKHEDIGAGTEARMTMSPQGPSVDFYDWADGSRIAELGTLDRARPKLPDSAGIYEEIVQPNSWAPQLKSKTQGGPIGYAFLDFGKMPKGCPLH
ncbi:hypothetical protein ACFY2W_28360 [Streptomyces sp. NPDC001262]|uniref:hypothetical protein n=1 Tax=unclassified Streptomyces TaxID=2593676 RepID=UPI0036C39A4F